MLVVRFDLKSSDLCIKLFEAVYIGEKAGTNMKDKSNSKQFQNDIDQYKMPEALKRSKQPTYNVGYEATTGNQTSPDHNISKKE